MAAGESQWRYGSYSHAVNEVALKRFGNRYEYSRRNRKVCRTQFAEIGGTLFGTASELTPKIQELAAAYAVDGKSSGLYIDTGSGFTLTPHNFDANHPNAKSQVRVVYRDWPTHLDAEYATGRTYRVVLEQELWDIDSQLFWCEESLTYVSTGGAMVEVVVHPLTPPTDEIICQRTVQSVIQSGVLIGLQGYPFGFLPPPLFPSREHMDRRRFTPGSAVFQGAIGAAQPFAYYPLNYSYTFSLITPVDTFPTSQ
jgi:hypothetical protein